MRAVVQISSGTGPVEVREFVAMLAAELTARVEAAAGALIATAVAGGPAAPRSIALTVDAPEALLSGWVGTHELVRRSPRRGPRSRKRWFAGVEVFADLPEGTVDADALGLEVIVEVCRAGGPGGQHVNRRNSAVRVVHASSGLSVRAEGARSQHQNRRVALRALAAALAGREAAAAARAERERRHAHYRVQRGDPVAGWEVDARGQLRERT